MCEEYGTSKFLYRENNKFVNIGNAPNTSNSVPFSATHSELVLKLRASYKWKKELTRERNPFELTRNIVVLYSKFWGVGSEVVSNFGKPQDQELQKQIFRCSQN
eukprot:355137-Rhodomonas_salina.3